MFPSLCFVKESPSSYEKKLLHDDVIHKFPEHRRSKQRRERNPGVPEFEEEEEEEWIGMQIAPSTLPEVQGEILRLKECLISSCQTILCFTFL